MGRTLTEPRVVRSVSLSYEFDALCRQYNISVSDAVRVGISLKLAELGIKEYDNNLNITRRIRLLQEQLEKTSQELYEVKNGNKK